MSTTPPNTPTKVVPLASRMKSYEHVETLLKFDKTKPLYIRVDGRGFSRFTRGMAREDAGKSDNEDKVLQDVPGFSSKFSDAMQQTAKYLLDQTDATLAYVQSDEISLVFKPVEGTSEIFFTSEKQKIVSTIASLATAKFLFVALEYWPERCKKVLPTFDCRALELPNEAEVANTILWRCRDGTRNSINTICRMFHSSKSLHGVNSKDMLKMLEEAGIDFGKIPRHLREGTFYKKEGEVIPDEEFATMSFERKLEVIFGSPSEPAPAPAPSVDTQE